MTTCHEYEARSSAHSVTAFSKQRYAAGASSLEGLEVMTWLLCTPVGYLMCCLVGCLMGYLVGYLVGCLVGCVPFVLVRDVLELKVTI